MLFENIRIDHHNPADAQTGQFFHDVAAQPAAPDHGNTAAEQGQLVTDVNNGAIALIAGRQNAPFQRDLFNLGHGYTESFCRLDLAVPGKQLTIGMIADENRQ